MHVYYKESGWRSVSVNISYSFGEKPLKRVIVTKGKKPWLQSHIEPQIFSFI